MMDAMNLQTMPYQSIDLAKKMETHLPSVGREKSLTADRHFRDREGMRPTWNLSLFSTF